MTKYEFIDTLRKALSGFIPPEAVEENIRYYESYLDAEMAKGGQEEEILSRLGDPRLLAKTIIEARKHAGTESGQSRTYGGGAANVVDEEPGPDTRDTSSHRLPGWLVLLLTGLVMLLVFSVLGIFFSYLLPVLFPILMVVLVIRLLRSMSGR